MSNEEATRLIWQEYPYLGELGSRAKKRNNQEIWDCIGVGRVPAGCCCVHGKVWVEGARIRKNGACGECCTTTTVKMNNIVGLPKEGIVKIGNLVSNYYTEPQTIKILKKKNGK